MDRDRRRRGRRRGRKREETPKPPEERGQGPEPPEVSEESEAPGVLPSHLSFRRRRPGKKPSAKREKGKQEGQRAAPPARTVSPLAFWRRGQPRTFRPPTPPRQTLGRLWQRLTGFYFPPWLPVAGVMLLVSLILVGVILSRQVAARPLSNQDHWHARYDIYVCGQKQPVIPEWHGGGVHTHADGIIHIHPFSPSEEGSGARLVKFFEYSGDALGTGAELSKDTLHIPGEEKVYKSGDPCEGDKFPGEPGVLQVFSNQQPMGDFSRYIPQDGDAIRIVFAPEGKLPPGTQASPTPTPTGQAARSISVEASDRGSAEIDSFFAPDKFNIGAKETVEVAVKNTGSVSHTLRIAGSDGEYDTDDDIATGIITPGEEETLRLTIDTPGSYPFRCDIHPVQKGELTVEEGAGSTPSPSP